MKGKMKSDWMDLEKKEETAAGGRWVDARESDDHAAGRWEATKQNG